MKRLRILLFATVFIAHAYFYNGGGWNQSSRFDPIYSFVEPGTPDTHSFRINRFMAPPAGNTGDWAVAAGNFYSNKAPGTALLGIPAYFVLFHLERSLGFDPAAFGNAVFNAYIVNLWISVLWTSIATVWLLDLFAGPMAFGPRDALFGALVFALGTLVFPFDSELWGHPTAAAFLIIGHAWLVRRRRFASVLAGFCLGASVLTEYLTLASLPIAAAYLATGERGRRDLSLFLIGALPPIAILLLYQKVNFGGWLVTAAALTNPALEGANFGALSTAVLWNIVGSWRRGALVFMPVLAAAGVNAFRGPQPRADRRFFWLAVLNLVAYLVAVACYRGWDGGNATGPRYLIVSLPFWCLLLPPVSELSRPLRTATIALAVVSFANMFVIAAVDPMVHADVANPLYADLYRRYVQGHFSVQADPFYVFDSLTRVQARRGVFNLGQRVSLPNPLSTLPLLIGLGICVPLLFRWSLAARDTPDPINRRPAGQARTGI